MELGEIFFEFSHMASFSARSANPLGKLMDFLQEDVDSMQVGSWAPLNICFFSATLISFDRHPDDLDPEGA